jgi:hypothetical protein
MFCAKIVFQSIFLCFIYILVSNHAYKYRIIRTPIFHFTEYIKQHHIIVIEPLNKHGLYAVDFTPLKQNNWKTLLHLFLGINIPSEIRVRYLMNKNIYLYDDDRIIQEHWKKNGVIVTPVDLFYPVELLQLNKHKWRDPQYMNLYTHNCQHFSYDFTEQLDMLNKNN